MAYNIKSVTESGNLEGKTAIVRFNLNVPIINGAICDDLRIKSGLRTLSYLRERGAKILIIGHIENAETDTLEKVAGYVRQFIPLTFATSIEAAKEALSLSGSGGCVLLENLRHWEGEKSNDPAFARALASLGDLYVNEDFAVSHRPHASVVGLPRLLPRYGGFAFMEEIEHLSRAFSPERPFLFILGGAKFETKMPLIRKFLNAADFVYVAGALANDFFRERGYEMGRSVVSEKRFDIGDINVNPKLYMPSDVVVERGGNISVKKPAELASDDKIFDAGPDSLKDLEQLIKKSKFVLWNGPLGDYEKGFSEGSEKLAGLIAKYAALSIVGGGDTLAVIHKLGIFEKFTFISTGGGATLEFLANETLVGIEALRN